jgi:hypothetical protein
MVPLAICTITAVAPVWAEAPGCVLVIGAKNRLANCS